MSTTYYDDNFGRWKNTNDPEVRNFYRRTQRRNVKKTCSICERTVYILPQYDKCNRCADMMEGAF